MATKWVYMFKEGDATMRNLLGGKGANLAEMTNLGLPVPQLQQHPRQTPRHDQPSKFAPVHSSTSRRNTPDKPLPTLGNPPPQFSL